MSKRCAKCEKTVYPTEELKCLDKIWHKACFRCTVCGMSLNMKNYKGFEKNPYCNAHYPTLTHTKVVDTPEFQRLKQVSKNQSNLAYHEEFEKEKGKFTVVTDDPESRRLRETQAKISQVKYHQDFEQNMKGKKTSVADDPEMQRLKDNTLKQSNVEYWGQRNRRESQEAKRDLVGIGQQNIQQHPPGMHGDYHQASENAPSPYSARQMSGASTKYSDSGKVEQPRQPRAVGSIANYDPVNNQYGSIAGDYNSSQQQWTETVPQPQHQRQAEYDNQSYHDRPPSNDRQPSYEPQQSYGDQQQSYDEPRSYGRQPSFEEEPQPPPPAMAAPVQGKVPLVPLGQPLSLMVHSPDQQEQPHYPAAQQQRQPEPAPVAPPASKNPLQGAIFRAMYDYDAADDDEVSFRDNDTIIDPEPIDEGWMYGRVQRTGQAGMLPANYVERVQ